jgi:hypothetical protein
MSRTLVARAVIVTLLGWAAWAGPALALGPGSPEFPKTPPAAQELPPGHPPVDNSPSKHPLLDWVKRGRPLGCWASFNGYGCSSLHSELAFIFGGCRTFFAEPCLKGAPPSALPPSAGIESGYYPGGAPTPGLGLPALPARPDCRSCP